MEQSKAEESHSEGQAEGEQPVDECQQGRPRIRHIEHLEDNREGPLNNANAAWSGGYVI